MELHRTPEGEPYFHMMFGEELAMCTPDNTAIYRHTHTDMVDHIFVQSEEDEEEQRGRFIFRDVLGGGFDPLVETMEAHGYFVHDSDTPSDHDTEVFVRFFMQALEVELEEI